MTFSPFVRGIRRQQEDRHGAIAVIRQIEARRIRIVMIVRIMRAVMALL